MTAENAELWRAARRQISEYEHKSSELALLLQAEKDNLQALQKEVDSLGAEKLAALRQAAEVAGRVQQGNEQLQTLTAQAQKEAEEGATLIKHLELLRDSKRDLAAQFEADR
ncbi:hypothetical protein N2152v2_003575 [Parachlorella kessleri]